MNSFNAVGRLTKDPELRVTQSGKSVTNFNIAVNRSFSDDADFFNGVAWGKLAENVANYTVKGQRIAVTGRLQSRTYEDRNGDRKYVVEIVANEIEFLSKPSDSKGKKPKKETDYSEQSDIDLDQFEQVDDSEIPF